MIRRHRMRPRGSGWRTGHEIVRRRDFPQNRDEKNTSGSLMQNVRIKELYGFLRPAHLLVAVDPERAGSFSDDL